MDADVCSNPLWDVHRTLYSVQTALLANTTEPLHYYNCTTALYVTGLDRAGAGWQRPHWSLLLTQLTIPAEKEQSPLWFPLVCTKIKGLEWLYNILWGDQK